MNLYETILSHFSCYFPHFILGSAPWRFGRQRRSLQLQNRGISLPPETGSQTGSERKSVLDQLNGQDP